MIEFVVYLSAQDRTHDVARQALPGAPVRPDPVVDSRPSLLVSARARLSATLRRLADRIEPAPASRSPVATACS